MCLFIQSLLYSKHLLSPGQATENNETLPDLFTGLISNHPNKSFHRKTSKLQYNPKKEEQGLYRDKGKLLREDGVSVDFKFLKEISRQAQAEKNILGRRNNICKGPTFMLRQLSTAHNFKTQRRDEEVRQEEVMSETFLGSERNFKQ